MFYHYLYSHIITNQFWINIVNHLTQNKEKMNCSSFYSGFIRLHNCSSVLIGYFFHVHWNYIDSTENCVAGNWN